MTPSTGVPFYLPSYDSHRNVTVALESSGTTYELVNEQWVIKGMLEGVAWSNNSFLPTIAYRSATGHTVVLTAGNGLWVWDGQTWQQESLAAFSPRFNTAVAYDPYRDTLMVFGGHIPPGPNSPTDEMWEYDFVAKTWTQVMFAEGPSPRQRAGFVFDPNRNLAILFGGRSAAGTLLGDTWEYDPATGQWTEYDFGDLPIPPARERVPMAYHSHLQVVVLSGGNLSSGNALADFWMFDGERWVQRFPGDSPLLRGAMTYDSASNVTRQWIEHPNNQYLVHSNAGAPVITSQPDNQTATPGQPVQFKVKAEPWLDSTPLAYQWRRNGQPIPGATLSAYTIFAVSGGDVGAYDCVVMNGIYGDLHCGKAVSIAAILTIDPGSTCTADLSGDGTVGVSDLLMLLSAWGPCP